MSVVIRLKVPIEMHCTVIPMGTSKVNSSPAAFQRRVNCGCAHVRGSGLPTFHCAVVLHEVFRVQASP